MNLRSLVFGFSCLVATAVSSEAQIASNGLTLWLRQSGAHLLGGQRLTRSVTQQLGRVAHLHQVERLTAAGQGRLQGLFRLRTATHELLQRLRRHL